MRTCFALFIVVLGTTVAAAPASEENLSDSGNAFVRQCSAIENTAISDSQQAQLAVCAAYLMGISDGIKLERSYADASNGNGTKAALPYCVVDTNGVENGQMIRILLKYIRDNPEKAHMITAGLFIYAMGDAFPPCPNKR